MAAPKQRDQNGFTPTQARIAYILQDGQWHNRKELMAAIDEQADSNNLNKHLGEMRKIIAPRSESIVCQLKDRLYTYRLGRRVDDYENG